MCVQTYIKAKTGRGEQLYGGRNSGAGFDIHLKVDLDATEIDPHCRLNQEILANFDGDSPVNCSSRNAEIEIDCGLNAGYGRGADTVGCELWLAYPFFFDGTIVGISYPL